MSRLSRVVGMWMLVGGWAAAQSLEDRVKELEEKMQIKEEEGATPEPGSPAAAALSKNIDAFFKDGLAFKSKDGNFEAAIGGRAIVHFRFHGKENERRQIDQFSIRQAKIHIQGKIWKDWEFKVEASTSGGAFNLDDTYVGLVRWKQLQVRVGQFKAPFSLEELTSTRFIDLPERSLVNRLVPAREIGIMAHGELVEKVFGYALMLSHGTGRASNVDQNSDKDVTARLWLRPGAAGESDIFKNIHLAFNWTAGRQDRAANTAPYTFSDPMMGVTYANLGSHAPAIKFDESRYRLGYEFAWLIGPASFKAEYVRTNDQYTDLASDSHHHTHFTAYYASATCLVTGDQKTWDRIRPNKPLFGTGGGIGALEIAARFSRFEINRELIDRNYLNQDTSAREINEYALGLNWFPNANVRISVAYSQTHYQSDEHHEPLVISGKRLDRLDQLIFRFQVDF